MFPADATQPQSEEPTDIHNDEAGADVLPRSDLIVDAVYEDGVIKPLVPLDLPPQTKLRLHIATGRRATAAVPAASGSSRVRASVARIPGLLLAGTVRIRGVLARGVERPRLYAFHNNLDMVLFALGLGVYALTRLWDLTRFPIYFFSDEAIQATLADDLLKHGFRDHLGRFLPTYFLNAEKWNLSLSVYIHLVSVALFGKSEVVTRGTSAVISILSAVAVALTLKLIFKQRFWWTGTLVMALIPAWFLHSRTAFEMAMMVPFYACFLCLYLLYRYRSPRYLYPALVLGGMTFYSYAPRQGVMLLTGVLLFLSDLRYHLRNWRTTALGALLVLLLAALRALSLSAA